MDKFLNRRKKAASFCLEYAAKTDLELLRSQQVLVNDPQFDTDLTEKVYRVFHHSFKMYRMKVSSIILFNAVFKTFQLDLGVSLDHWGESGYSSGVSPETSKKVALALKRAGASDILLRVVLPMLKLDWDSSKNRLGLWCKDAPVLISGYTVVLQTCRATTLTPDILWTDKTHRS